MDKNGVGERGYEAFTAANEQREITTKLPDSMALPESKDEVLRQFDTKKVWEILHASMALASYAQRNAREQYMFFSLFKGVW